MTGINFGGYGFTEPMPLPLKETGWASQPGLYAILVPDPTCRPRPYRPVYFGESDNINHRATPTHESHSSWRLKAGSFTPLYRALCPLWGLTKTQRQQAESLLIATYNPPGNDRLSCNFGGLMGIPARGTR